MTKAVEGLRTFGFSSLALANNGKVASNKRLRVYTVKISIRLLIIGLLAIVSGCPTAIGQQPGAVNIRPRVTASQPGIPNAQVTVDRNRVPLGDEVTFTIARESESVVKNPRFTVWLYLGDDSLPKKMGLAPITYVYRKPGTYTYRVRVEKSPLPNVQLIANPTMLATNSAVNFAAQLSRNYPNIQYRFVFGDGAQTDWQDAPQAAHTYAAAGTYRALVDIGERNGGLTTRFGGSPRQPIEVTNPAPRGNSNTNLPPRGNTNNNFPRRGNTNNNQPPRGNANTNQLPRGNTNNNQSPLGNTNTNQATNTNTTTPANTNDNTTSTNANSNSNSAPPSNNGTTPTNSNANTIETSTNANTSPSTPCVGDGCEGSWPWWLLLLIALLLILLAYKTATFFLLPRPKFVPHVDSGNSRVAPGKPLAIDLQLDLDPDVTGGQYGLDTGGASLIKSERGSNG